MKIDPLERLVRLYRCVTVGEVDPDDQQGAMSLPSDVKARF